MKWSRISAAVATPSARNEISAAQRTIAGSPSLVLGGTDSRHFAAVADDVYRFMPFRLGPQDLTRFHGTDERFEIEQIERAVEFYRRILRAQL